MNVTESSRWIFARTAASVAIMTIVLGALRFAHHTPDSKHYISAAEYYRAYENAALPHAPFVYRILSPMLAAGLPFEDLSVSFAVMNIFFTILAFLFFAIALDRFALSRESKSVALFLVVVSFPTVNYSSGVLTDPLGFMLLASAFLFLLSRKYNWFIG